MNSVTLQKLTAGSQPITGTLARLPQKGKTLAVEFGNQEYVTTPIIRLFQLVDRGDFYFETTNSRYHLKIVKK